MGGAKALGVRVQLHPPSGVTLPSGGGGTSPRPRGGVEGRRPCCPQAGGGVGGEGRGGCAAVPHPPALGGGPWPPSLSPSFSGAPILGIHVEPGLLGGRGRRSRPGRPPVGQCDGGWERGLLATVCPPPSPGDIKAGRFVCAFLGAAVPLRRTTPAQSHQSAAGNAGVCGRSTGGAWRVAALAAAVGSPPLGAAAPPGGGAGQPSLRPSSGRPRAGGRGGGEDGQRGGGEGGFPAAPPLPPWRRPPSAAGGRPGGTGPGGPAADWGGALFSRPPLPFKCRTVVQALARAPRFPHCRRAVPAGRGGGGGGDC